ncbi:DUF397 domain-containing protein [Nocardia vinacea]
MLRGRAPRGQHGRLRDAKNPTGPALVLTPFEWDTFTASASSN